MINMLPLAQAPCFALLQPAVSGPTFFETLLAGSVSSAETESTRTVAEECHISATKGADVPVPEFTHIAMSHESTLKPVLTKTRPGENSLDELPSETASETPRLPELPVSLPQLAVTIVAQTSAPVILPKAPAFSESQAKLSGKGDAPVSFIASEIQPAAPTLDKLDDIAAPVGKAPITTNSFVLPPAHASMPTPEIVAFSLPPVTAAPQNIPHLDLARDLAWIGNLAQEIVAASQGTDQLTFRLIPQSLGQLDVAVAQSSSGLQVEMTATTERATQIIAAEQPRLIEELRQSGIKMVPTDQATGQHNGSQRHSPQYPALPFAADAASPETTKSPNRPDGRFA